MASEPSFSERDSMFAAVIGIVLIIGGAIMFVSVIRYWPKMDDHFRTMGFFMTIFLVTFGVMLIRT